MPKKQLQHFEKRLLEERKRVLKELGHYDEAFGATSQESRRRSEQLFVPHGGPGHRRDGAREGVPVREPGRALPLAHRRGAAPAVSRRRRRSASATTAATRSRSSGWTRCRTRATASSASSARKMRRRSNAALFWPVLVVVAARRRRARRRSAVRALRAAARCRTRCCGDWRAASRWCTIPARRSG